MSELFDSYLIDAPNIWYIFSSSDRIEDENNNVSWKLQEGHSGPILTVNYDSISKMYTTGINDYFYQFGNIVQSEFSDNELKRSEFETETGEVICCYDLTTASNEVLVKFLFGISSVG